MEAGAASIIRRMLNREDHRALAERCVRLAQACSKPKVAQYLMALAANYPELAELTGGVRRETATGIALDQRRKAGARLRTHKAGDWGSMSRHPRVPPALPGRRYYEPDRRARRVGRTCRYFLGRCFDTCHLPSACAGLATQSSRRCSPKCHTLQENEFPALTTRAWPFSIAKFTYAGMWTTKKGNSVIRHYFGGSDPDCA